MNLLDIVLHLDTYLLEMVAEYGIWVYGILFAIIFMAYGAPSDKEIVRIGEVVQKDDSA